MRVPTLPSLALLTAGLLVGCGKKPPEAGQPTDGDAGAPVAITPQGKVLQAAENEALDGGPGAKKAAAVGAKEKVDIPGGGFAAGSTPGDRGRDPTLEPALLQIDLGGYSIDKYLYPNDPQKPPVTGVTRTRAAEMCQDAGGRLCTELEWERACKGPEGSTWAGSATWDAACAKAPATCVSGFGALGMGSALREWTASDVAPIENTPKAAAVRGAKGDAAGPDHRCAHRTGVDATSSGEDLGFRCCHGAPNAASIPAPPFQQTFRKAEISTSQLAEMIATVPELKELSRDISYYKEPDDVNLVLSRGDAGVNTVPNTTFTTQPILWSPVAGEEILVVAARAQKSSFIVAFYRLPGDRYRIAASLLLKDEKGPILLGENSYIRKRIPWGLCWDCRGESGHVSYRDDNRVVITQK